MESYWLYCQSPAETLFTENETNSERLYGVRNSSPYVKDGIHEHVVRGRRDAVNPLETGTKAAVHYCRTLPPGAAWAVSLRLCSRGNQPMSSNREIDALIARRQREADAFYRRVTPFALPEDMRNVQRQAFAGMLWNKQYYRYMVNRWLDGDAAEPPPPAGRRFGRNQDWRHFSNGGRAVDAGQVGVSMVRRLGHSPFT